jgi:pimeloyl-ACP methyl ester carboxylesterase
VPRVEETPCSTELPANDRTRCLTLVVPESRSLGTVSDRLVRIPVAIIDAWGDQRSNDPVVWMDFSAGDGMLKGRVSNFTENDPHSLNEHRDVITLDVRGTGFSEPNLDCQEVDDLNKGAFAAEVDPTSDEGRGMRLEAVGSCRERLVADGVDLAAYASEDAAQDLEDLRQVLGVQQWNLVVGEYPSKLAQLLARDHPETIRSVIVHAQPLPLQADWFADQATNAWRGWSALVDGCAADASCNAAYPDLQQRLESYVTDLEANPRRYESVPLDAPGVTAPFLLTASRLLAYVRWYGRAAGAFFELPFTIGGPKGSMAGAMAPFDPDDPSTLVFPATDAYAQASWGVFEMLPQNSSSDHGTFALGAYLSAMCRDEAPFTDTARLAAALDVPLFGPFLGRDVNLEACEVWDVPAASPSVNEPAVSDVPFLVLAGAYDTVSSPEWADAFAEGLTHVSIAHMPGVGSMPTANSKPSTSRSCAADLRVAFITRPDEALDLSCVATATGPAFALP